jgi:tetratricopeptide (TPR) repeat protein
MPPRWRIVALKARADAYEAVATDSFSPGLERDQKLALSLADNRAWASLAPDDPDAAYAVALGLKELGGYPEALAAYRGIAGKWPDEDYRATIRVAAAYRIMGQLDQALATLDGLVKRKGPQTGMRYFYHRGRILLALGRADEAAKSFTEGLKDQPDYRGAFMYRACALAAGGRLADALSDQQTVIDSMLNEGATERPSPAATFDIAYAKQIASKLRSAIAVSRTAPVSGLCDGYWDDGDNLRTRSPLLPPEAPTR